MTPDEKAAMEAVLQRVAEELAVDAIRQLAKNPVTLAVAVAVADVEPIGPGVEALRRFFNDVADGLERNWGYSQEPRLKVGKTVSSSG